MAFTGPIEDRLLIRELFGSYGDATTRCDVEAYLACWAEDGVRIAHGAECRGKAELRRHWTESWERLERMAFFTEVAAIEVNGDRATARSHCREIMILKGGDIWKVVGRYEDELVRQGGAWLFARKSYELLIGEPKLSGRAAGSPPPP